MAHKPLITNAVQIQTAEVGSNMRLCNIDGYTTEQASGLLEAIRRPISYALLLLNLKSWRSYTMKMMPGLMMLRSAVRSVITANGI